MTKEEFNKKMPLLSEEEQILFIQNILDSVETYPKEMFKPYKNLLLKMKETFNKEQKEKERISTMNKKLEDYPIEKSNNGYTIYNTNKQ